jgi:prevent-host-death family protein
MTGLRERAVRDNRRGSRRTRELDRFGAHACTGRRVQLWYFIRVKTSYSIAAGQKNFPKVVAASEKGEPIPIERHGETVAYVISKERFDAVLETMELLSNPEFASTLRAYEAGKTKWTSLKDIPE